MMMPITNKRRQKGQPTRQGRHSTPFDRFWHHCGLMNEVREVAGPRRSWMQTYENRHCIIDMYMHGEWMRTPLTNAGCEDPSANLREIS